MEQTNDEAVKREMYERTRDIIRVRNPLGVDFKFKYDSVWYVVKAKQEKDMERYLADKYFHDISIYIIGYMAQEMGNKMLEERRKRGMSDFLNKYDENYNIWNNVPRTDNKELLEKVAQDVIVGLVEKFGSEAPPPEAEKPEDRTIPLDLQVMRAIADKPITEAPLPPKPVIKPLKKTVEASEVTVDDQPKKEKKNES
jgi:hypothetical protein